MAGKRGKIDLICPSFVTPFEPGKKSPGLSQMISMKENIYTFVLFFCHLILTLIAHGMIMKLQALIICSVASLFVANTIFFIFFNLSKTRYTLLPGIKITNKLLCCNQATLLIW